PEAAGALAVLRAATRPAHAAIDGAFDGGLRSRGDYVRYLRALLPLADWLQASWRRDWPPHLGCWHDAGRADCLREDLAALGESVPVVRTEATPSAAAWMGGCYVIEGSVLGARLLARDVAAIAPGPDGRLLPRAFLDRHLGDPGRWPRFRATLALLEPGALPEALHGAEQGFALVAAALAEGETPA